LELNGTAVILTEKDWKKLINKVAIAYKSKYPNRRVEIEDDNCLVLWDEIMKSGKPYRGHSIRLAEVETLAEAWSNIQEAASK